MISKEQRTEDLVDLLLRIVQDKTTSEITTLVGHRFPDDDVWLCCWMARKWMPKAANAKIVFVNAGERFPGSENDPQVLHFDTGGGEYDQHGKGLRKTCSAVLLAQGLGLAEDPALQPLLEMVIAVDNVEPLPHTVIHYLIEGYPRRFRLQGSQIDWKTVEERVFEDFDIIYDQEVQRHQSRAMLKEHSEWTVLPNGVKIAALLWHPELREAAFEEGATVVIWTRRQGPNRFYTGIQRNRNSPIRLANTAATLRLIEAKRRNIDVRGKNLTYIGNGQPVPQWFLHDSLALILNGSRTWKPKENEYTILSAREIVAGVIQVLSAIPRTAVSSIRR